MAFLDSNVQESGVQEALTKGYLKTLILAVYTDPDEPENLIEGWSFNFGYTTAPDGSLEASLSLEKDHGGLLAAQSGPGSVPLEYLKRQAHKIIRE